MLTPFETFFAEDFQRMLDATPDVPGLFSSPTARLPESSWDRKAAYLLWECLGRPGDKGDPQW